MAAPEGSALAKPLLQPGGGHLGQAIHLPVELGPVRREAVPNRLVSLAQVPLGLLLVPPALGPGQALRSAAQPHLAA